MKKMTFGFAFSVMALSLSVQARQALPPPTAAPSTQPALPGQAVPVPATAEAAKPSTGEPKIQFAAREYDFGKVKAGDPVKYSYVFTNTGNAVLEVTHVQPSCGCTTAGDWTHKVEPGQTGTIPI